MIIVNTSNTCSKKLAESVFFNKITSLQWQPSKKYTLLQNDFCKFSEIHRTTYFQNFQDTMGYGHVKPKKINILLSNLLISTKLI